MVCRGGSAADGRDHPPGNALQAPHDDDAAVWGCGVSDSLELPGFDPGPLGRAGAGRRMRRRQPGILVQEGIYDEFVHRFAARVDAMTIVTPSPSRSRTSGP